MSESERYEWLKYEVQQISKIDQPVLRWARLAELVGVLNNKPTDPCALKVLEEQAG